MNLLIRKTKHPLLLLMTSFRNSFGKSSHACLCIASHLHEHLSLFYLFNFYFSIQPKITYVYNLIYLMKIFVIINFICIYYVGK